MYKSVSLFIDWEAYKQQKFISYNLESWKSKIRVPTW